MSFDGKQSCFALQQNTTERRINTTDRYLLVQLCIFIHIVIFKAKQGQNFRVVQIGTIRGRQSKNDLDEI